MQTHLLLKLVCQVLYQSRACNWSVPHLCWPGHGPLLLTWQHSPGPEEILLEVDWVEFVTVCQVHPLSLAPSLNITVTPLQQHLGKYTRVYRSIQEYAESIQEYTRVYKSIQEYVEYVEYAEYTRFTHTSCRCNHNSITIISLLISAQHKLVRQHSINNVGSMQYLHHTWRKTTLNYKPLVTLSTVVSGHGGKYGRFKPTVVCCSHWCTPSGSPPPRERGLQCTTDWEWG